MGNLVEKEAKIVLIRKIAPRPVVFPIMLFIATIATYGVTRNFEFLATWDDKLYVILNETIQGITLANIKTAFSTYYIGNYAPLHILSYMLDHALWGLTPSGYHLENVLIHALNGVLFYQLLRRLEFTELRAAAASWIFLFHPVQVETVAWISQRKNLLAMLFFLITFHSYHSYNKRSSAKLLPYLLALLSMLAATLSKSIAVIFPLAAVLYEYSHKGAAPRPDRRLFDKIPFILVAAAVAGITLISQGAEFSGGIREYPGGSILATFITMVPVVSSYLRDCFWPFELSPFYMIEIRHYPDGPFLIAFCVLGLTAGLGVWLYRRMCPMIMWYGLFFVALLPVLQIVPLITLKNDRYLYFPLLGFSALTVAISSHISHRLPPLYKRSLHGILAIILMLLPLLAHRQTLYWRNDVTIWTRAIEVDPENRIAWPLLAKAYTARKDSASAAKAFRRYLELRDEYGPVPGFYDL